MPVSNASSELGGDAFRFRVSDVVRVPLRGYMLRLRLNAGQPRFEELKPGRRLRLRSPDGLEHVVTIKDHAIVGGRQTQERLDRTRELDIIIPEADAFAEGRPIEIGWFAVGAER